MGPQVESSPSRKNGFIPRIFFETECPTLHLYSGYNEPGALSESEDYGKNPHFLEEKAELAFDTIEWIKRGQLEALPFFLIPSS